MLVTFKILAYSIKNLFLHLDWDLWISDLWLFKSTEAPSVFWNLTAVLLSTWDLALILIISPQVSRWVLVLPLIHYPLPISSTNNAVPLDRNGAVWIQRTTEMLVWVSFWRTGSPSSCSVWDKHQAAEDSHGFVCLSPENTRAEGDTALPDTTFLCCFTFSGNFFLMPNVKHSPCNPWPLPLAASSDATENHLSLFVATLSGTFVTNFQEAVGCSSLCCFSLPIRPSRLTDIFEDFGYHSF